VCVCASNVDVFDARDRFYLAYTWSEAFKLFRRRRSKLLKFLSHVYLKLKKWKMLERLHAYKYMKKTVHFFPLDMQNITVWC